jgi:hypothetical protein
MKNRPGFRAVGNTLVDIEVSRYTDYLRLRCASTARKEMRLSRMRAEIRARRNRLKVIDIVVQTTKILGRMIAGLRGKVKEILEKYLYPFSAGKAAENGYKIRFLVP